MQITEAIAAYLGLVCAWYSYKQNIWTWPTGIISYGMYVSILFHSKLYADAALQIVFIVMLFYGWWCWLRGQKENNLPISNITSKLTIILSGLMIIITPAIMWILHTYTDSQVVFFDASTTAASLITQYLLARKIIENWLCWFVIDAAYTALYWYKGLYYTTALYVILTVIAVISYYSWKKLLIKEDVLIAQTV